MPPFITCSKANESFMGKKRSHWTSEDKAPITHQVIATFNYSCNTGMSDLPDMYTRSPRAEGGHIRQTTSNCVATINM